MDTIGRIRFKNPLLQSQHGEISWPVGQSLMNRLMEIGLPVASSCGGDGVCTKCRLFVSGTASTPSQHESFLLKKIQADPQERISCQVIGPGDIEVDARYW